MILQSVALDDEVVKLMDKFSTTAEPLATFNNMLQVVNSGGLPQFHEIFPILLSFFIFVFRLCDELCTYQLYAPLPPIRAKVGLKWGFDRI